jgi:hypothetical protein
VDALQATLGDVLLIVAGLAVILLAVILILAEVALILRLTRKLSRRPEAVAPAEGVPGEQGGR